MNSEEIFKMKQEERTLKDYYSSVKGKWEELSLYQPYPQTLAMWKMQQEQLKVVTFLSGLADHYESAKQQYQVVNFLPRMSPFLVCPGFP